MGQLLTLLQRTDFDHAVTVVDEGADSLDLVGSAWQ